MNYAVKHIGDMIAPGSLLHLSVGTAIILEVVEADIGKVQKTGGGAYTRRNANWTITFMLNDVVDTERLYLQHSSYNLREDLLLLGTNPLWVRTICEFDIITGITTIEGDYYELD